MNYNGFHNIHAFNYFTKHHVPAVEPFSDLCCDEELLMIKPDLSQTKVLVRDRLIQSHLVTKETSVGCVPLVSLQA